MTNTLLQDEMELLVAAFPDEVQIIIERQHHQTAEEVTFELTLRSSSSKNDYYHATIVMTLSLRTDHGNGNGNNNNDDNSHLHLEIMSYRGSSQCPKHILEETISKLRDTIQEMNNDEASGESSAMTVCMVAHSTWMELIETHEKEDKRRKLLEETEEKVRNIKQQLEQGDDIHWITSEETIVDRKSIFQAHVCRVSSEDMVRRALNKLYQSSSKIQKASHNMYAYRFKEQIHTQSTTQTKDADDNNTTVTAILKHDNNDDGEDGAGSRLAHLLEMRNECGILVVVSRWFGGIHLGSKRFVHISNAARNHLDYCHTQGLI